MSEVEHTCNEGILTITLNRPEKLNALNHSVLSQLSELFTQAKDDASIKALLLTGAGKSFCAGADIKRLAECNAQTGYEFAVHGQSIFNQLEQLGKPSLAAVNGFAFGGGCELAMAATFRFAAHTAQFGQPEVKLGIIPGYGGTQRLSRLVGKGRALDLCLTGRFINAETALNWGLVNQVIDKEELMEQSYQFLNTMLTMPPLAIKSIIETINTGYDFNFNEALQFEALHFAKTCASKDKIKGVEAFLNKTSAIFSGE